MRTLRRKLENLANELKQGPEAKYENDIILGMSMLGIKSANYPDLGMVTVRESYHYEITDMEKLSNAMFVQMVKAVKAKHSAQDAVLLQGRISRDALESLVGEDATEEQLAQLGVRKAAKVNVSITKK